MGGHEPRALPPGHAAEADRVRLPAGLPDERGVDPHRHGRGALQAPRRGTGSGAVQGGAGRVPGDTRQGPPPRGRDAEEHRDGPGRAGPARQGHGPVPEARRIYTSLVDGRGDGPCCNVAIALLCKGNVQNRRGNHKDALRLCGEALVACTSVSALCAGPGGGGPTLPTRRWRQSSRSWARS